jgi:hypothetical protein
VIPTPDEKIGPFTVRVRPVKGGFRAIVIDGDSIAQSFDGADESAALDAARAHATTEAARRRPAPRAGRKAPYTGPLQSIDDLRAKFLRHFPGGFADARYLAEERAHKLEAQRKLLDALPLADAFAATPAQCDGARAAVGTNMLSRFEMARLREVLVGSEGPRFLRGAACLASGDAAEGLAEIDGAVRAHGTPSWTIATYLPSLWAPESAMLMRITATQRVANWLGHDFTSTYVGKLEAHVHARFLDLAETIRSAISDLEPRDLIDVQGFIWVAAEYE